MLNLRFLFLSLGLFALTLCSLSNDALAFSVNGVRFGTHQEKTRMVLDLSETTDFRVFALDNPYRLVIDLPGFDWKAGDVHRPASTGISAVRHGNLKPGISRLVFDLNNPVAVRAAFVLPRQASAGKPDRLVIDFGPTSQSGFAAEKNKILGSLDVENAPAYQPEIHNPNDGSYRTASAAHDTPAPPPQTKKPLIVIDPGHGGVDPGALGPNKIYEKNVVLALAKELRDQLLATGQYRVMLTRDKDIFIKLRDRVAFARKHEADLFISLHADSIDKSNVRGASFYTLSEKASDAQTAKLAKQENNADLIGGVDLSHEDEQVANILVDLTMRDTTNQGKYFANQMVDAFRGTGIKVLQNAHRHAGFAVLKAPDIPSLLIEAGFMSNHQEAQQLNTQAYRKQLSKALLKGIDKYFEQVKKNQRL